MSDIATLVDRYQAWLKDRTALKQVNGWTEITTPFLDRHNDYVQIYAKREDGGLVLSDDGHTLNDLLASGCALDSPRRQAILQTTLNGFGVKLDHSALVVRATADNFPLRKHNLIQAMLAVNDMFWLASPITRGLFLEDVAAWLDLNDVRYLPRVKLSGASGFDHIFDFAIPKSRRSLERLLRAIGNPTRERAESFAFAWVDTAEARKQRDLEPVAYAILNDEERPIPPTVNEALEAYGIRPVPWSAREDARDALLA